MPIRFSMGHIKRLLVHFNMKLLRKGGFIYGGLGKDGIWRTSDTPMPKGMGFLDKLTSPILSSIKILINYNI